jgi:CelD/BcsL family acetyltransferase involved in cellulose biosynthesis
MRIQVLSPQDLTRDQILSWRRLQAEAGLLSPFLSPEWVSSLAAAGGPDGQGAKVAVIEGPEGPLGFLPARVSRSTAMPPGAPLCDYQALVAEPDLRLDPRRLVDAFGVARIDFDKLLTDQPAFRPFIRGAAASFIVDLKDGYEAYAANRTAAGSDILKDCAKKKRKLVKTCGPARFTADSLNKADFDQLIAWKRAQYQATGQPDIFLAGWPLRLLEGLFAQRDPECCARLFTLHVADQLVAAQLALCAPKVVHAWFIAHDDAYGRHSPGLTLMVEVIRWAAAEGMHELDLGPGDYRFKRSLANRTREVAHGFVGRPSGATLARSAAYGVRAVLEALPLGSASALPGKAMRRLDVLRSLG